MMELAGWPVADESIWQTAVKALYAADVVQISQRKNGDIYEIWF